MVLAMFLLVRDEDAPTVAAAITAFADEGGLEPVVVDAETDNPLAMVAILTGPRAVVSEADGQVVAFGLESLGIADAEAWGSAVSAACETEVIAVEASPAGAHVHVYDNGELDERIDLTLDRSGRTPAPQLAELTDHEPGRRELTDGIAAFTAEELLQGILRSFGVIEPSPDAVVLAFRDPRRAVTSAGLEADGDAADRAGSDADSDSGAPRLVVELLPAAGLSGEVDAPVQSPYGSVFGVSLQGVESIDGLRLELSGDALSLFRVDSVEVAVRVRGTHQLETREIVPTAAPGGKVVCAIDDAFLESVEIVPPVFDGTDMFTTMQRIMSAGEARQLNTVLVNVTGTGAQIGDGALVLTASAAPTTATTIAAGEAMAPVRIA